MIFTLALNRAEFPLSFIPLSFIYSKLSHSITVSIVKVTFIDFPIMEMENSLSKFASIHELSLEILAILSVGLLPMSVL